MTDHADTIRRRLTWTPRDDVEDLPTDDEFDAALEAVLAERKQAIDALREIAVGFDGDEFQDPADGQERQQDIARAALLSLGEQP